MTQQEFVEYLKSFVRVVAATVPGGGGLAQAWSELDLLKKQKVQDQLYQSFARHLDNPDDASARVELVQLLRAAITDASTDSETRYTQSIDPWTAVLRDVLLTEVPRQLATLDPSSGQKLRSAVARLIGNESFTGRISSSNSGTFFTQASNIAAIPTAFPSRSLGSIEDVPLLDHLEGFSVACPAFMVGSIAILFHMRYVLEAPIGIDIQFAFAHALELALSIERHTVGPDACIFGDAASLAIVSRIAKPKYELALLLPRIEQRIVKPTVKGLRTLGSWWPRDRQLEGTLLYISDQPSTPLFHLEQLKREGRIDGRRILEGNLQPHEGVDALETGDEERHIISWSPHWQIYQRLQIGEPLRDFSFQFDTLLFVKASLAKRKPRLVEAFKAAVRRSWLDLRSPLVMARTVERMIAREDYVRLLYRYCGLHAFSEWSAGAGWGR